MKNNSIFIKVLSIFLFITGTVQSQNTDFTDYTILWDVTWSMKGACGWDPVSKTFDICPDKDIWDETKELIIETINNIPTDGTSNVLVYPFDNPGASKFKLEYKQIDGLDEDERDQLIEWVRAFDGPPMHLSSNTNVCLALDNVYEMKSMGSNGCKDNQLLFLFTDGKQNVKGYNPETCVDDFFEKFCDKLCNCPTESKLYNFILKAYQGSGRPVCECIVVVDTTIPEPKPDCKILKPIILDPINTSIDKGNEFLENPKLDVPFKLLGSSLPSDFKLSIDSNNNNLIIKDSSFDAKTKVLRIVFEKPTIIVNSSLETVFDLFGETDDECYKITINPFTLHIENKFVPTATPSPDITVVKTPNY